jgi:bifunctional non-homologous end joining protein LigD
LSDAFDAPGPTFFKLVTNQGLEGMVSKRTDLPYRSGRTKDWLKVKCVQSGYFAIVGYELSGSRGIANRKLATEDGGVLRYVGAIGTGFSAMVAQDLLTRLKPLAQKESPVAGLKAKDAVWTRPALIAEVNYRGLTGTGELRHASFKGLAP